MADTLTDNFKLTIIEQRKGWAGAMNTNIDRLGNLFVEEADGSLWLVNNAKYNHSTQVFTRKNTAKTATGVKLSKDGVINLYQAPVGTGDITWSGGEVIGWSNVSINADKNMNGKKLTNVKSVDATTSMSVTDVFNTTGTGRLIPSDTVIKTLTSFSAIAPGGTATMFTPLTLTLGTGFVGKRNSFKLKYTRSVSRAAAFLYVRVNGYVAHEERNIVVSSEYNQENVYRQFIIEGVGSGDVITIDIIPTGTNPNTYMSFRDVTICGDYVIDSVGVSGGSFTQT